MGSHTEKATVLFCCVWEGFGRRLLSAAVELRCGPGEAILSRAKDEARAQERGLSSHGPLFGKGEKDYCRTHRDKKKKKESHQSRHGVWPGLREQRGWCCEEGTVACGVLACVYGGLAQAQTRGSGLDSHGLSGKDTVLCLSITFAPKRVVSSHVSTVPV